MTYSCSDFTDEIINAARRLELIPESESGEPDDLEVTACGIIAILEVARTHKAALMEIREKWGWEFKPSTPVPEDYDDTESAYSNGYDVAAYECALVAKNALEGK